MAITRRIKAAFFAVELDLTLQWTKTVVDKLTLPVNVEPDDSELFQSNG